jgi:ankyrin repeat protein
MRPKRAIAWGAGVVVVTVTGLYGELVRETSNFSPPLLLACADVEMELPAWTCKQVLMHRSFPAKEVSELNRMAAAAYPVSAKDTELAEEVLSLFIVRGVDINAIDEGSKAGWSALHSMAVEGNPERIKMLLRHGARPDLRNRAGMTPLDYARQEQGKFPKETKYAEVVRLLEEAEKQLPTSK